MNTYTYTYTYTLIKKDKSKTRKRNRRDNNNNYCIVALTTVNALKGIRALQKIDVLTLPSIAESGSCYTSLLVLSA